MTVWEQLHNSMTHTAGIDISCPFCCQSNRVANGLKGFPSAFAAFKWLDTNAKGSCSWKLNGESRPQPFRKDYQ